MVTFASGITAPETSVTVPTTSPVFTCPTRCGMAADNSKHSIKVDRQPGSRARPPWAQFDGRLHFALAVLIRMLLLLCQRENMTSVAIGADAIFDCAELGDLGTGSGLECIPGYGKPLKRGRCIWLSVLLASSACAFALDPSLDVSQYAHTAWKVREGFTKGTIFAIAQTPDGYLWLGTESGLARFDGVQAVPWQPPNGEQLPSNLIQDLLVARDGTLWIGTHKGLASWKDGKLTQYPGVAGHRIIHCCRILEERSGLGPRTRAGSVPSEPAVRSATGTGVSAFPYLPYTRTTKAICGSRLKRVCGDGRLVLPEHYKLPGGRSGRRTTRRRQRCTPDDNQ